MYPIANTDLELLFVPRDRVIGKEEIENINKENIDKIKRYVYYTFPQFEYSDIDHFLMTTMIFVNKLPSDCLLLCPGDSPFLFSYLVEYMYGNNEYHLQYTNHMIVNNVELSYKQQKRILFLRFPLSEVTYNSDQTSINNYLLNTFKLADLTRQFNHVGILDHISGGATIKKLKQPLKTIFIANPNIYDIRQLYLESFSTREHKDVNPMLYHYFISETERFCCRGQDKYKLQDHIIIQNKFRHNVILTLFYLRFLSFNNNMLGHTPLLEKVNSSMFIPYIGKIITIQYYNIVNTQVTTITHKVINITNDTLILNNTEKIYIHHILTIH